MKKPALFALIFIVVIVALFFVLQDKDSEESSNTTAFPVSTPNDEPLIRVTNYSETMNELKQTFMPRWEIAEQTTQPQIIDELLEQMELMIIEGKNQAAHLQNVMTVTQAKTALERGDIDSASQLMEGFFRSN